MREAVVSVAIVLLACVAAPRLRVEYASNAALPEVAVLLSLPPSDAADLETTTGRWLTLIEPAIRAAGDVVAMRGDVSASGARLTVRFRSGVDPELKTARLLSDLASVRAQLPRGARLDVIPLSSAGSRPAAYVAVTGSDASRVAEELRGVDGVRDVEVWGETQKATEVRLLDEVTSAQNVRDSIAAQLAPRRLGAITLGSRTVPLVESASRVEDVRVSAGKNVLRLASIATIHNGLAPVTSLSRLNGKPAVMMAVYRDDNVSLFRFERALERLKLEIIDSEAAELRHLLVMLAIGALCASIVLRSAYVPVAIAAAMNLAWITGFDLDAASIIVALIAIIGFAPLALTRRSFANAAIAALCVVALPIAAKLASGSLGPAILEPSRAFALGGFAAIAIAPLIRPSGTFSPRRGEKGLLLRNLLRHAATLVLGVATFSYVALTFFGDSLDPRTSGRDADRSRLYVRLTLPAGTTLAQTASVATTIDQVFPSVKGIARTWTTIEAGHATSIVEIEPRWQTPQKILQIQSEIENRVPLGSGAVVVGQRFNNASTLGADELEEQPEIDEDVRRYRFILKSTRLDALRRAVDSAVMRVGRVAGEFDRVTPEWGATSTRVELIPRRDATAEQINQAAATLIERTVPASQTELSDRRLLRVSEARAPKSEDDVPQASDLLVNSLFERRDAFVFGSVQRELGRFIVPVTVNVFGWGKEERIKHRIDIDRAVAQMPLDSGVSAARPEISTWHVSKEKMRLFALVAFLPSLLFAFAAIALSSLSRALVSLAAPAAALAVVAPGVFITSTTVDEVTLMAIAAALCCVAAMSMWPAHYRDLRQRMSPFVATSIAAVLMFVFAAPSSNWRSPLIAAMLALASGSLFAAVLPASLMILVADARRRISAEARAAQRPAKWERLDEPPQLAIDNITKIYRGGVRSLHRVSFELAPGVIGLLGPNGAGKTTLLRILCGLLEPTRGELRFRGIPVRAENLAAYRRHIGFLPQEFNAWPGFTAEEFLDFWAIERGIESKSERSGMIARLLEEVGLTAAAKRRVRDYSGGMRQRIGIARALIGDPPIVIVDEPTTGLDIEARVHFREVMLAIARQRIVILSTHIAGDVEAAASRILLLEHGVLRYDGPPDVLVQRARGRVFESVVSESDARALSRRFSVTTRVRVRKGIRIRAVVREGDDLPGAAVDPTLEEAYLAIIAPRAAAHAGTFAFLNSRRLQADFTTPPLE